ncbi:MAG: hypothetical protein K1Y01_11620 [Vicinamibacteria bacterium]|nr:hypothetical protein [Vicinamibacteria bacterium]
MRLLRALSLDVVAGTACGGLLAEHVTQTRMTMAWWVALLTAVWSVYTADHLLDAFRSRQPLVAYRHVFHHRNARVLLSALALTVSVGLVAAFDLRPPVRLFGAVLSVVVLAYLASAQGMVFSSIPKEPVAGVLYAAGIWGGPLLMATGPRGPAYMAAALHACAAVLNLVMFGLFETDVDRLEGTRSLGLSLGHDRIRRCTLIGGTAAFLCALALVALTPAEDRIVFVVLAAQVGTPAAMLLGSHWFRRRERYRLLGDSVFLLGALPRILA